MFVLKKIKTFRVGWFQTELVVWQQRLFKSSLKQSNSVKRNRAEKALEKCSYKFYFELEYLYFSRLVTLLKINMQSDILPDLSNFNYMILKQLLPSDFFSSFWACINNETFVPNLPDLWKCLLHFDEHLRELIKQVLFWSCFQWIYFCKWKDYW